MSNPQESTTHLGWPLLTYLPVILVFMAGALFIYWPIPELAFRSDNSPVSWLSSAQLWAMAVVCLRLTVEQTVPRVLGLWLFLAMVVMSFDEQFMLHEQWKFGCQAWVSQCQYVWVRELPMLMVGFGGMATAVWLHRVVPHRLARAQLWAAIGVGVFALSMDLLHIASEWAAYEEAFEVLAEALFLSFLLGLQTITIHQQLPNREHA